MNRSNERITFVTVAWRLFRKLREPGALQALRTTLHVDRETPLSLGLLLEQRAAEHRDHIALKFGERSWTWAELNTWANRYAHCLAQRGLSRGDVVAINMNNSPELVVTVCAVAKLGAVSAMLNTAHHAEVLKHSLTLVKPKFLVAGEDQLEAMASVQDLLDREFTDRLFCAGAGNSTVLPGGYTDLRSAAATCFAANPDATRQVLLKEPCFYIYTSGTTGLPKAAVMSHYRWYRSAVGTARLTLNLTPDDVFYCCMPLYHSNPLNFALGSALVSGAALAIGRKFSASGFWDEVRNYDATVFSYIGEMLRYLLNQAPRPDDRRHSVRRVFGNGLRPDLWDAFKTRFGIERIYEFYGSSEGNNGFVNFFNFDKTCGWSGFGWQIVAYDLDADAPIRKANGRLQKLGPGDTGLLLFEVSDTLPFDGYTDQQATEKKLLRDVFRQGDCWFNTGDLVKHQGSGHVQFVDRLGDTFRWNGENVATTEVEAVINAWPQTADAVVYGVQVPGRDGRCGMVCYTPKLGEQLDLTGFAAHLRRHLPKYAVPRFLRLHGEQDTTGTFKHQKASLKKQGYAIEQINEPVFLLTAERAGWEPLTGALSQAIRDGHAKL
ncbi:MAG: long-chain-acyl-CoA synthetase [Acidobacteria bacterium]|nr:long-chain-acyl-CoA synthetase [Acidobacteriota bacterium]